MRNITQFRAQPERHSAFSNSVAQQMALIRNEIKTDLTNHETLIDPVNYFVCSSCGRIAPNQSCYIPTVGTRDQWMRILCFDTFLGDGEIEKLRFYHTCKNSLRKGQVPFGAKCRGWAFKDAIPSELADLTKFERQLLCLRLPCVYIWRAQGGFGQYGCRGAPISFSNPVSDLAKSLPRNPSKVFRMVLESGRYIEIDYARTYKALCWLRTNNPLYKDISIDVDALRDIRQIQLQTEKAKSTSDTIGINGSDCFEHQIREEEISRGTQGPLDMEGLEHLSRSVITGVEDSHNFYHAQLLIRHMLCPFTHRRRDMIPSYDACEHLESYFPTLFPYGRGGTKSTNTHLGLWVKHALSVFRSRFSYDLDFIFFVYSVLKRKRLTGLASHAPIREISSNAIIEVREMLSSSLPSNVIAKRIDVLLRSVTMNASFETLRGSPAFWAGLKKTSWAYLTRFGACQLFVTISAADLIDPYVYCQINPELTILLSSNPVSATTIFHRRVQSIFDNFLLGETKPFGETVAYLGRIEQQSRHSPHLHLLIWLRNRGPTMSKRGTLNPQEIAEFIELFSTALLPDDELTPQNEVAPPAQESPPPKYVPLLGGNLSSPNGLMGGERHELLSRPYNKNAFDGSIESNPELRGQILSTQLHRCNTYCRSNRVTCRFHFPFPAQPRASVASRSNDPMDSRCIALSARSIPNINSTHPLLTAMCHANTDVTVITGSSIPESMYVCSYAVKADKNPIFDKNALRKLKAIDNGVDDRNLLGAIARSSSGVRTVGAQEVVDFLLDNPLTFSSAKIQNVDPLFLLRTPTALSDAQREEHRNLLDSRISSANDNILSLLDCDEAVAVASAQRVQPSRNRRSCDKFLEKYMKRPTILQGLSASEFHEGYDVRALRKGQVTFDESLLLLKGHLSNQTQSRSNGGTFIAVARRKLRHNPKTTHILNVPSRGRADDESPLFAAAALSLHVPFRSVTELLGGMTLTDRLHHFLEKRTYAQLNTYVSNCHDLATALHNSAPRFHPRDTPSKGLASQDCLSENENEGNILLEPDEDEIEENPLVGLPPLIAAQGKHDPLSIINEWNGASSLASGSVLQLDRFKDYVKECKNHGISAANRSFCPPVAFDGDDGPFGQDQYVPEMDQTPSSAFPEPIAVMEKKNQILSSARNKEQKVWLQAVLSYVQVYYSRNPRAVPVDLKKICRRNHPIFTNAPGGCGKSWLLSQVDEFLCTSVPDTALPVRALQETLECSGNFQPPDEDIEVSRSEMGSGRLGRIAVFAPSGVAAGNAKGFTFHNGLRTHKISYQHVRDGVRADVQAQLIKDFAQVLMIVIDEYSMASFMLIGYLDRVTRSCRPAFSNIPFGGIPIIITGDGLQLPVVSSYGLLSSSKLIPECLQDLHQHCTVGVFYLQLSQSVRQQGDQEYAKILLRMRLAVSTEEDVILLNSRSMSDMHALLQESTEWRFAPVLIAKNKTAHALNKAAIFRNANELGTFHLRSIPISSRSKTKENLKRIATNFFNRKEPTSSSRTNSMFIPPPITPVYPRMPIMLRTNICPSLGLSNGSIGRLIAVIRDNESISPHETNAQTLERFMSGSQSIPSLLVSFPNYYRGAIGAIDTTGCRAAQSSGRHVVLIQPQTFERIKGLPISPAHAMNMHKSQSLTLPYSIIDPRDTFCMGALYVAFSRSPSLKRIALISPVSVAILNKYSKQVGSILHRLEEIQTKANSLTPFLEYIAKQERCLYLPLTLNDF